MTYNYLELVNSVARRLNETELTSTNFSTAKGFYGTIKDAVNSSIRDINQYYLYWPYNHNSDEITLVAGETRYSFADEAKYVDFDTFRVKRDTSLDVGRARKLRKITYVEYVDRYIDQEDETDTTKGAYPSLYLDHKTATSASYPCLTKRTGSSTSISYTLSICPSTMTCL